MKINAPHDVPTHMLSEPEKYITRMGRILRRTSLDEIPQIWDIFRGKMSVIGPRPALWNQKDLVIEREKYGANDIKPGLTGLAQINGRDELEISEKARIDGKYTKVLKKGGFDAFFMDLYCFFRTIVSVWNSDGVVEGGTGEIHKTIEKKKSILVVCQYYYPEPFRINALCEVLVKHGFEVQVVTGMPNYPEGEIYKGYDSRFHLDEVINGVKVHRCPIVPRKTGIMYRFLNYYSYAIQASGYVRSKNCHTSDGKTFDIVFVNQLSPVMMAEPAIVYKKKYKVPVVMYCLDLWPESLCAGGIKRNSVLYKYYHGISKRIYNKMDKIFVTSRMFSEYMRKHFKLNEQKISYLPQFVENVFEPLPFKHTDTYDFMFAGNIGKIQSVETIIKSAKILKDHNEIRFHIVGGGSDLERVKRLSKGLNNVRFYGRQPVERMPDFYSKADAMLITLKADPFISMTLPGKVQSYMAVGKPVIGAVDGEAARVLKEAMCGYCGKAESEKELAGNILQFIKCEEKQAFGENARKYFEKNFGKKKFDLKFVESIRSI